MKKLILTFIAVLPFMLKAQSGFNLVDIKVYPNKSHITDTHLLQDSILLIGSFVSDVSCPYPFLTARNLKGDTLWTSKRENNHEFTPGCFDVIYSDNNYVYTVGWERPDDVINLSKVVLSKYDRLGNTLFSKTYRNELNGGFYKFDAQTLDIASDGAIIAASNDALIKSDINGAEIREYKPTIHAEIRGAKAINPLTYIVYTENKIYKTDSSFQLLDSVEFTDEIHKIHFKNDTAYTLLSSNLLRLDNQMNIIDTIFSHSTGLYNFEFYQDKLWIQVLNGDSIQMINYKEATDNETFDFPVLLDDIQSVVVNDKFVFVGNTYTQQVGMYAYQDAKLSKIELSDIAMDDFNISNIEPVDQVFGEDTFTVAYEFDTELTVKNNGTDTINDLALYAPLHEGAECFRTHYYEVFSNLEILPGKSHTFNLRRLQRGEYKTKSELCFEVLAPNAQIETKIENNSLCKTFTITGLDEDVANSNVVYPNPTTNLLTIYNTKENINQIQVLDMNGKVLLSQVVNGNKTNIATNHLAAGIYMLHIQTNSGISSQLFTKK